MPEVVLTIPGRLPGFNEYTNACRHNRYKAAAMKRRVEADLWVTIRNAKLPSIRCAVRVAFAWYEPNRRRDLDNVASAKKFILDALVTAGVLVDDSQRHVVDVTDEFAVDRHDPRVVVTIRRADS